MSVEGWKAELLKGWLGDNGLHLDCDTWVGYCERDASGLARLILEVQAEMPCYFPPPDPDELDRGQFFLYQHPPLAKCLPCAARAQLA